MARFHDLVREYNSADDENRNPTIFDDLTSEYESVLEGFSANTAAKDQAIAEREAEIQRLKSRNYELLEQVSSQDEPFNKTESNSEEDNGPSIDKLFVRKG
jgi:hypothetical protein